MMSLKNSSKSRHHLSSQCGIALITSLLLLLVITILAVGMFRSLNGSEKVAGNLRDKQRAFNAAVSAQKYAEWWLSTRSSVVAGVVCTAVTSTAQVCSNPLAAPAQVPWQYNNVNVGVSYTPPGMVLSQTGGDGNGNGTYYLSPQFYVYYLGPAPGTQGGVYQIDAVGYGGSASTTAVVESTFQVTDGVKNLGGL